MDRLFRSLPFVFTYLDDHLIASRTLEEHMEHLSQFFQVLQDNGLTINPAKCTSAASSVKFLGHMVSESGITPLPKHVTAIQEFPAPTTIKQLQQFLGIVNFYSRFLPRIAATLQPLTDLLRGNPKTLEWTASMPKRSPPPRLPLSPRCRSPIPPQEQPLLWRLMHQTRMSAASSSSWKTGPGVHGIFLTKIDANPGPLFYIRSRVVGGLLVCATLPFPPGRPRIPDPHRPQTIGVGNDPRLAALVKPATAASLLPGGIHFRPEAHLRQLQCGGRHTFTSSNQFRCDFRRRFRFRFRRRCFRIRFRRRCFRFRFRRHRFRFRVRFTFRRCRC
jgi:hypothetical protein